MRRGLLSTLTLSALDCDDEPTEEEPEPPILLGPDDDD